VVAPRTGSLILTTISSDLTRIVVLNSKIASDRPYSTGSSPIAKATRIVAVAALAASEALGADAKITSTGDGLDRPAVSAAAHMTLSRPKFHRTLAMYLRPGRRLLVLK
jgi:hypothetical protein